jgi:hypothetical protein
MTNMSEEQIAAQEAEVESTEVEETTDDETTEKSAESEQDFKSELERERKARAEAEKAAADLAFKLRDKKRRGEDEEDYGDEKPLTASQLQAILAEERQATEKKLTTMEADKIASSMSGSDEEKELILEIHKNRSFPSHLSLAEQLEEAYLIANKKKIIGENNELKRALKGRQGVNNNSASTHHDEPVTSQPKISGADAQALSQSGFAWNGTTRRFEKKLSNGKKLVIDQKTKKPFII